MSNNLALVEPHAKRLEDAADKMDSDGIGGHPTRGHAVVLRQMAGSMRADAAVGKLPHVMPTNFGAVSAVARAAPRGRLVPLRSAQEAIAANVEHAGTVRQLQGEARRMNFDMPLDRPISSFEVDQAFRGASVEARMSWKFNAARIGIFA